METAREAVLRGHGRSALPAQRNKQRAPGGIEAVQRVVVAIGGVFKPSFNAKAVSQRFSGAQVDQGNAGQVHTAGIGAAPRVAKFDSGPAAIVKPVVKRGGCLVFGPSEQLFTGVPVFGVLPGQRRLGMPALHGMPVSEFGPLYAGTLDVDSAHIRPGKVDQIANAGFVQAQPKCLSAGKIPVRADFSRAGTFGIKLGVAGVKAAKTLGVQLVEVWRPESLAEARKQAPVIGRSPAGRQVAGNSRAEMLIPVPTQAGFPVKGLAAAFQPCPGAYVVAIARPAVAAVAGFAPAVHAQQPLGVHANAAFGLDAGLRSACLRARIAKRGLGVKTVAQQSGRSLPAPVFARVVFVGGYSRPALNIGHTLVKLHLAIVAAHAP